MWSGSPQHISWPGRQCHFHPLGKHTPCSQTQSALQTLWGHSPVPHSHKSSHRRHSQGQTWWCLQDRSSLPPRVWNSGRGWTGKWVLLQGHRPGTPCEMDTPQSRPPGYGSASQCRHLPWHRGLRRPVHWHTPYQSQAQSSYQTGRLRSSAWEARKDGTRKTGCP